MSANGSKKVLSPEEVSNFSNFYKNGDVIDVYPNQGEVEPNNLYNPKFRGRVISLDERGLQVEVLMGQSQGIQWLTPGTDRISLVNNESVTGLTALHQGRAA